MSVGFGTFDVACPKSEAGHKFQRASVDDERHCLHCGIAGRGKGSFIDRATAARTEFFSSLHQPASAHGTKVKR